MRLYTVTVGPTGAAKVLHALRPEAFPPWDDPIRISLGYSAKGEGYRKYLQDTQALVRELEEEASRLGVDPNRIPELVERPKSSLPKLIDEYNWVTLTKRYEPPSPEQLEQWWRWATGNHTSPVT